jgi:hypothetical protein
MRREVHLGRVGQQQGAGTLGRFKIGLAPVRTHDLLVADGRIAQQTICPQRFSPGF